ncbi:MAG: biotin/lipoyl-binding protein [Actinomycetota bacterium]|nr:biotin/lipoyl-binding protein [Actinomycetota bacterium]MCL6093120.1 biotin/lipoyl-binding protein [Actinomycetota bacterium]MDA8167807.1 biotin/lipoyl-binding protein [Actinomycetota bacterium]
MKISKLLRKKPYVIGAAVVVLLGGYFVYSEARGSSDQVHYVTAQVKKGMIASTVSASGNVSINSSAKVTSRVSGTVTNITVKVGDHVTKGEHLFDIINNSLDVNVSQSYASLEQARSSLSNAEASARQAQSDYDNAVGQNGAPASANIAALQAQVNAAITGVNIAQSDYNSNPSADNSQKLSSAQAQLAQAQSSLTKAEQQNQASGESASALGSKLGAAESGVSAAEQNVAAAQASYNNQKQTADERTVTAPIDGTITAINVQNGGSSNGGSATSDSSGSSGSSGSSAGGGASGESAGSSSGSGSSSAAMVIDDLNSEDATVQVSEVDVTRIAVGQKASLSFDAIDGLSLTGKVEQIDASGTVSSGVVNYSVTVGFDTSDPRIKPGMSVTADITTAVHQDVITVPNSALKSQGSSHYVQVMKNGSPVQQPVNIGIANDTDTEITSGLNAGDTIVVQTINPNASSSSSSSSGGGGFNLGGGALRGGGGGGLGGRGMISRGG